MISKATQYLHRNPGICRLYSFYILYIHVYPKLDTCPLHKLAEVKPVLSYMTYISLCSLFKIKRNINLHSKIGLVYTGIYCIKFHASRVVTAYT